MLMRLKLYGYQPHFNIKKEVTGIVTSFGAERGI